MFIALLLLIAKSEIHPNIHQLMNGKTKNGLTIQWIIIYTQKERKY